MRKNPFLNVAGVFSSATQALSSVNQMPVDVMLSDIDMPELNGLEFHSKMMNIPVCVFISAYPDYAADSFEMEDFFLLNKFACTLHNAPRRNLRIGILVGAFRKRGLAINRIIGKPSQSNLVRKQIASERSMNYSEPTLLVISGPNDAGKSTHIQNMLPEAFEGIVSFEWSSGQMEGQVKIKRTMYGKAKFDLLRLRVLTRNGRIPQSGAEPVSPEFPTDEISDDFSRQTLLVL